jgi:hypothetical protein
MDTVTKVLEDAGKLVRRNNPAEILRKCCPVDCRENDPATVAREPVIEKPMIEDRLAKSPYMRHVLFVEDDPLIQGLIHQTVGTV